jgi:hypothetical protein
MAISPHSKRVILSVAFAVPVYGRHVVVVRLA